MEDEEFWRYAMDQCEREKAQAKKFAKEMVEGHRPAHREYIVAKAYLDCRKDMEKMEGWLTRLGYLRCDLCNGWVHKNYLPLCCNGRIDNHTGQG